MGLPSRESGSWLTSDHDSAASGCNPQANIPTSAPKVEWEADLGSGDVYPTAPTIATRVFVGTTEYSGRGDPTTTVRGFDPETGNEHWRVELAYEQVTQPTFDPDSETLYVLSGQDRSNTGPGKGEVLALDPASGEENWRFTVSRKLDGGPIISNERVIVKNSTYDKAAVHALDATTGDEIWRFETGPVLHYSPTVSDGTVYVSRNRTGLCALDIEDGSKRWCISTRADATRPVVGHGTVHVGYPRGLESFCAGSGERAWRWIVSDSSTDEQDLRGVNSEPVIADDRTYVKTSDTSPAARGDPEWLYALTPRQGTVEWRAHLGTNISAVGGDPVGVADGVFAERVRNGSRELAAFRRNGTVSWTRSGVGSPMAVSTNRLLAYRSSTLQSFRIS